MASRIKGITVEIGGDTSGLERSLNDVNNSIKKTQSQLRYVNNLLKLDPSNTVLLAQKQELLQEAIGGYGKEAGSVGKGAGGIILRKGAFFFSSSLTSNGFSVRHLMPFSYSTKL